MNFIGPYSDLPFGAFPVSRPGRHTDIRKIAPSTGLPVDLADVMEDLHIDSADDRSLLKRLTGAAGEFLEKRTGCSVIAGRYEAHFNEWCGISPWEFHRWPLREVIEIAYYDCNSSPPTWVPVDLTAFMIQPRSSSFLVMPLPNFRRPPVTAPFSGVRVRFVAGFDIVPESGVDQESEGGDGDDDESKVITADMRTILTMLVGHFYENRELYASDKIAEIEAGAGSMLASNRKFW
jgi:uncharacterized phiE125 gp8 family phage protein